MYFESRIICESEYHLLFMQGLAPVLQAHIKPQEGDLHIFVAPHRTILREPPCDIELFAFSTYELLLAIVGLLDQVPPSTSSQSPRVASAIVQPSEFDRILLQVTPEPEEIVAMCTQILEDSILVDKVVAAMQGSYARHCQPQAEKRQAALLCRHLAKQHSPNDCCICRGQRHPIEKCWHVTGLPVHYAKKAGRCDIS
jgi:hypothetical protein